MKKEAPQSRVFCIIIYIVLAFGPVACESCPSTVRVFEPARHAAKDVIGYNIYSL